MKHTWSFITFEVENITHTSQMALSSHSVVYIYPHQSINALPSFLLLIGLCGALGRIRVKHTCTAYIAKSNNGSMEKNVIHSDQSVHVGGNGMIMITP